MKTRATLVAGFEGVAWFVGIGETAHARSRKRILALLVLTECLLPSVFLQLLDATEWLLRLVLLDALSNFEVGHCVHKPWFYGIFKIFDNEQLS